MNQSLEKYWFILLLCAFVNSTNGQVQSLFANEAKETILLDGQLLEEDWQSATSATSFTTHFPLDSILTERQTEVKVLFDDEFLYVGVKCYGDDKDDFVVQSLKRDFDFETNDAFAVFIDPYKNKTSAFCFGINPLGVQKDGLIIEGGIRPIELSWNTLWQAEVHHSKEYWSAEMAIPFKSLRFNSKTKSWNINFVRFDTKYNEVSSWVTVPRGYRITTLNHFGQLEFPSVLLKQGTNITLVPYVASLHKQDHTEVPTKKETNHNLGLDTRLAIGSSLNLDLTINPDFSQAEVDEQVIDLSRFEIFFPEQRLFFLENSDMFEGLGSRRIRPFFSRRVGSVSSSPIPINFGARLSGNLNKNWRVGLMNAQTKSDTDQGVLAKNNTVLSAQRKIWHGSTLNFFITNRQATNGEGFVKNDYNRTGGAELDFRSENSKWTGKYFLHFSDTEKDLNDAIVLSLKTRYRSPTFSLLGAVDRVGQNYTTELGFVPRLFHEDDFLDTVQRVGYTQFRTKGYYRKFLKKNSTIDYIGPIYSADLYTDKNFSFQEHNLHLGFVVSLINTSQFELGLTDFSSRLFFPFQLKGLENAFPEGLYSNKNIELIYRSGQRKKVFGSGSINYGGIYMGKLLQLEGTLNYRHNQHFTMGIHYSHRNLSDFPEAYGDAVFDLVGSKIEVSFNRYLFFTTFLQYNTQNSNFNINSRFNWRFKPMSDLFIVYTNNYDTTGLNIIDRAFVVKLNYWLGL